MKIRFGALALACASAVLVGGAAGSAAARPLTAEDLVSLERVSAPRLSPDGASVVFDLSSVDLAANARRHAVMWMRTDGGAPVRLASGTDARFSPDGRAVLYLAPAGGAHALRQVFRLDLCAGAPCASPTPARQVTGLPLDVETFRVSPDGSRLVVSLSVYPDAAESPEATRRRMDALASEKPSGRTFDRLFIRHWDAWADGTRSHLFSLPLEADGRAGPARALTPGFDGDTPSKPFGDEEDYEITPDGRAVIFSARLAGKLEPLSTNFDLYSAPIDGGSPPTLLTPGRPAWDAGGKVSPDGRRLVWRAMSRPGFEADRYAVRVRDLATGAEREADPAFDRSADRIAFSGDPGRLYVLADDEQKNRLFTLDLSTGAARRLFDGPNVADFDVVRPPGGDVIVFAGDSLTAPADLYLWRPGFAAPRRLTAVNAERLKGVEFGRVRPLAFTGWNGDRVHGFIVDPPGAEAGAKRPAVLMIHGGPQGSWEDAFSYRWNPEVWAGWGYGVVLIDFHGSTGYGQAFTDAISNHWGDRPLEDLQKGWAAALAQDPVLDGERACAAGASYGGFMTYWIAGVWNAPFRCLVDHDGVFDTRLMGYETEELWFSEWENGQAAPWDKPENYARFDPMDHVAAWSKPILVIHSAKDFRIPLDQGIAAFTAAQMRGLPSRFLTFPDENHWVLKPDNSLQWHQTVHAWLDRWLGPGAQPSVAPAER